MTTDPPISPFSPDPYDLPPPWWQRHARLGVGGSGRRADGGADGGLLPAVPTRPSLPTPSPSRRIFWAYRRPAFRLYAGTVLGAQAVAWTALLWWLHHVTWAGLFLLGPFVGAVGRRVVPGGVVGDAALVRPARGRAAARRLALAGAWVLVEWSRTWLLGGFPWLPLAASQWQRTSVLQIAAYTGACGVSFVLIVVNIGFAALPTAVPDRQTGWRLRRSPEFLFGAAPADGLLSCTSRRRSTALPFTPPLARVAVRAARTSRRT